MNPNTNTVPTENHPPGTPQQAGQSTTGGGQLPNTNNTNPFGSPVAATAGTAIFSPRTSKLTIIETPNAANNNKEVKFESECSPETNAYIMRTVQLLKSN